MLRRYLPVALLLFAAAAAIPALAQSTTSYAVTANGTTDYRFDGTLLDPTLTLIRGRTYVFNVNATGHPFYIATSGNNSSAPEFTDGVTGNNVVSGPLTFVVPATAPNTLFYQCGNHNQMSGTLLIQDPPPVPALGPIALVVLGGLVLTAGYLARRRRSAGA